MLFILDERIRYFGGSSSVSMHSVQCILFNARITIADPAETSACGS